MTANQIIVALTPAAAELKAGMRVRVKIANNNTGATTMTVNALSAPCKTAAGQDLQKGMLAVGQIATFVFDGTNWLLTSVWSEKVVFTPIATIGGAAIGSLAMGVWGTHTLSLTSSASMAPVMSGSSFQLPDGKYMFVAGSLGVRHNNVVNATQIAQGIRLTKNGVSVQADLESTYLLAGQDATTYPQFSCVASVVAADVLSVQSYAAVTSPGDFNGANSTGATLTIVRVGN